MRQQHIHKSHVTKMHGTGNTILLINALAEKFDPDRDLLCELVHRYGPCDQIMTIEAPQNPDAELRSRIFNADGTEVEQCGNGLRCLGHLAVTRDIVPGPSLHIETISGRHHVTCTASDTVKVCMPRPDFRPASLPFTAEREQSIYRLSAAGEEYAFGAVSLGNPHVATQCTNIEQVPITETGSALNKSPCFPNGVNVGFMQILDPAHIALRVFERGVGETRACGSGACAAVAIGILWGKLKSSVCVRVPGGELIVEWPDMDQKMLLSGEVSYE